MDLFEQILLSRNIGYSQRDSFLSPDYQTKHNPFLLPDMKKAVERLLKAYEAQENITIYGDYDIDGITATALLFDAFKMFGYKNVNYFIPSRFVDGYGLTEDAIDNIAAQETNLIVTVDCGSLSHKEIERAKKLGVDVIVTDHHNVSEIQPAAVAVVNPKRLLLNYPHEYTRFALNKNSKMKGKIYPFLDLAGVGVAFKLVQALQTELKAFPDGQEKWLLDLVALGTVCDVVNITDENRINVFWGLRVLAKTRRVGLRALMEVSGIDSAQLSSRTLGFSLGPRMNAAGRLETAKYSIQLLFASDYRDAMRLAEKLDVLNTSRKIAQRDIVHQALEQAEAHHQDPVLILSGPDWNHGIVGIVASKLMETLKKPVFILQEMGEESKGSARSFGDFSVADSIRSCEKIILKGGGHKYAAGVTLLTKNIPLFRKAINKYYLSQNFSNQETILLPEADVVAAIQNLSIELYEKILTLEPFGNGNPEPIFSSQNLRVVRQRLLGNNKQHIKLELQNLDGHRFSVISFNAPDHFFVPVGERVTVWYQLSLNQWQGRVDIEGRLLRIERA